MKLIGNIYQTINLIKRRFIVLFLPLVVVVLTSCTSLVRVLSGFKNPKVESINSIQNYFENIDDKTISDAFFNNAMDSTEIMNIVLKTFEGSINVYNKSGERICVNGQHSCSIYEFQDIEKQNFDDCNELKLENSLSKEFLSLDDFFSKISLQNNETIDVLKNKLKNKDYIYIYYWSKFISSKKNSENDFNFFKNRVKSISNNSFIIRVNCDLREDWNLEKEAELEIKMKKDTKGVVELVFGEIPFVKNN